MKMIEFGDWADATPAAREIALTRSEESATDAARRHAENLLRQVIVQVRAVLPSATVVRVEIRECDYSDCGDKHPQVIEVRAGDEVLWTGQASGDPHDNVSGPWSDRSRGTSVHQLIAGALSWDPDELAGFHVCGLGAHDEVYELRFEF